MPSSRWKTPDPETHQTHVYKSETPCLIDSGADTHGDDDHAVFSDDSLAEGVKRRVRMILERRQLRLEVIQLHVRPEQLRLVHRRGHEHDHAVVFVRETLDKLRKREIEFMSLL